MIKYLNDDDNYDELIKAKAMIVDFYAEWCGPCRMLGSVLEQVDFAEVLKVNVDLYPDLAKRYGIMNIPTILAIKDGKIIDKAIGFHTLEEVKKLFED